MSVPAVPVKVPPKGVQAVSLVDLSAAMSGIHLMRKAR